MAEETELAYVVARIAASQASSNRTPAGRARRRIEELKARVWMRAAGRAKPLGLTPAEVSEIDQLCKEFPGAGTPHMTLEKAMELYELKGRIKQRTRNGRMVPTTARALRPMLALLPRSRLDNPPMKILAILSLRGED